METRNLNNKKPKTLLDAAEGKFYLIKYVDDRGQEITQPVLVGQKNVILLNGPDFGLGKVQTPVGQANPWLRDQVLVKVNGGTDEEVEAASMAAETKTPVKAAKGKKS